ncbi:YuzF family protein [Evansella sp. LMS18]|uniref:YuzF family protein n=1 Tax=Evansella sp. LMS18 TaxID=2924033 RepID=UPI0020D01E15|nr:YuzF family protein [Evansella sp. LMS18]UTR11488.1 YuzF family protein [Evansella sp. LMS18]
MAENRNTQGSVQYISLYDPFLNETLRSLIGRHVVIETGRGTVQGQLMEVKPDHITVQSKDTTFFIRIQEIIWAMPD